MAQLTTQDDFMKTALRLPRDLHARIQDAATDSGRSMNAEMVSRLEDSFRPHSAKTMDNVPERRKLELVLCYLDWCDANELSTAKSYRAFAKAYEELEHFGDNDDGTLEHVSDIDHFDPKELRELHLVWFVDRDLYRLAESHEKSAKHLPLGVLINELMSRFPAGKCKIEIGDPDQDND